MDPRRPTHLTLDVADLDRSLAFWHETLGLPVKLRTDDYAELQTETVLVVLNLSASPATGPGPALGWEVSDLDAATARLETSGVSLDPAEGGGMAGRRRRFRDPDGHVLELVAHVP